VWVFEQGRAIGYLIGAPEFVNRPFLQRFPKGIPGGSIVLIVRPTEARVAGASSP
jgi:hypothetical protein